MSTKNKRLGSGLPVILTRVRRNMQFHSQNICANEQRPWWVSLEEAVFEQTLSIFALSQRKFMVIPLNKYKRFPQPTEFIRLRHKKQRCFKFLFAIYFFML